MHGAAFLRLALILVLRQLQTATCIRKSPRYITTDTGRQFLIALTKSIYSKEPKAEIAFMTLHYEAFVTMRIPKNMYLKETEFEELTFETKKEDTAVKLFDRHTMIHQNGTGHAVKITADEDIVVIVYLWDERNFGHATVLPPISSYSVEFIIMLPRLEPYVLTLASHENTLVTYEFMSRNSSSVFLLCSWNVTCYTNATSTIVLNATTFSYFGWPPLQDPDSYDYPNFGTSFVVATRPILLISGLSYDNSGAPMNSLESMGNRYIIPGRQNLLRDNAPCQYRIKITTVFETDVTIRYNDIEQTETLQAFGERYQILGKAAGTSFILVESHHPVCILLYLVYFDIANREAHCNTFMLLLVHEGMWPNVAMFRQPSKINASNADYELMVITYTNQTEGLLVNEKLVTDWQPIMIGKTLMPYQFTVFNFKSATEYRILQKDQRHRFFAYASLCSSNDKYNFGTLLDRNYYHPKMIENRACLVQKETMRLSDDIDNDCDGPVDEEEWNGVDDDGDGLIDEDMMTHRTAGAWGSWKSWHYDDLCRLGRQYQGRLQRYRSCNNPPPVNKGETCKGFSDEVWDSMCEKNCSDSYMSDNPCPLGKYKPTCSSPCPDGCFMGLCDHIKGTCFSCKEGFKPSKFCDYKEQLSWLSPLSRPPSFIKDYNESHESDIDDAWATLYEIHLTNIAMWIVLTLTVTLLLLLTILEYRLRHKRKLELDNKRRSLMAAKWLLNV